MHFISPQQKQLLESAFIYIYMACLNNRVVHFKMFYVTLCHFIKGDFKKNSISTRTFVKTQAHSFSHYILYHAGFTKCE